MEDVIFKKAQLLPLNKPITYKALCNLLEQPIYTGNQKMAQLKEFYRYFEFEKVNRKIVITQIYDEPKDKDYYPNNAKYVKCIEKILLAYLSTKPGYVTYITSQNLFNVLGMINQQYIEMQEPHKKEELKKDIRYKLQFDDSIQDSSINYYINNFYDRCNNKFYSIIKSCFESFSRQVLINRSFVYSVIFQDIDEDGTIYTVHQYSDQIGDYFTAYLDGKMRETMDEFGYNKDYDIYSRGKKKEFFKVFVDKAKEEYPDIVSIYRCHKILYNQQNATKKLKKILEEEKDDTTKKELNQRILDYVNSQAKNIYTGATNETDFKKKFSKKYLSTQYYLSNKLINIDCKNRIESEQTIQNEINAIVEDTWNKIVNKKITNKQKSSEITY